MKKIKCMAVFAMLVVMAVFSSCGGKVMSIDEAVEAINNLKPGGRITIVLDKDTSELTIELKRALDDWDYLDKRRLDFDDVTDWIKYLKQNAKKVNLDLSKTKITEIHSGAFERCISLTSVTIPNGVMSIGVNAFSGCTSLTSVTIPDSVTTIGYGVFSGCYSLTKISVATGNKYFSVKDGVLYNKVGTILVSCPSANGEVAIPDGVTTIVDRAFSDCYSLTSVTIPISVTSIGDSAFSNCYSLTSVTIPDGVTSIGGGTFSYCTSLTSVTIPNSVTTIGDSAFYGCPSLTSVTIPNSVTSIGIYAFHGCTSLTDVIIPDSITSIGIGMFFKCTSLTSVYIPYSVTTIGDWAFAGCTSLTSVTIPPNVTLIYEKAFSHCESLHAKIERVYGKLIIAEDAFESGAIVSFRGTTGTWKEIYAKYWY